MTKKRFYVDKSGDFKDKQTGNIIVDFGYSLNAMECKMILDLLNELHEEKEKLEKKIKFHKGNNIDTIDQLERALKNNKKCSETIETLHKENEYLKNRLKSVLDELYCKDRVLEENEISIECCDKND